VTAGSIPAACASRWISTSNAAHASITAFQIEYSRNLLFTRGSTLDAVFQGLIDRTRRHLDVPKLRTIFGYKGRPHAVKGSSRRASLGFSINRTMT